MWKYKINEQYFLYCFNKLLTQIFLLFFSASLYPIIVYNTAQLALPDLKVSYIYERCWIRIRDQSLNVTDEPPHFRSFYYCPSLLSPWFFKLTICDISLLKFKKCPFPLIPPPPHSQILVFITELYICTGGDLNTLLTFHVNNSEWTEYSKAGWCPLSRMVLGSIPAACHANQTVFSEQI